MLKSLLVLTQYSNIIAITGWGLFESNVKLDFLLKTLNSVANDHLTI